MDNCKRPDVAPSSCLEFARQWHKGAERGAVTHSHTATEERKKWSSPTEQTALGSVLTAFTQRTNTPCVYVHERPHALGKRSHCFRQAGQRTSSSKRFCGDASSHFTSAHSESQGWAAGSAMFNSRTTRRSTQQWDHLLS